MEIGISLFSPDSLGYAHDLGCRWVYVEFDWRRIQPAPAMFDFSYYDPVLAEAADLGLSVIAEVSSERKGFPDDHWIWRDSRGMMPDPGAWREYLRSVVQRYGKTIDCWEIWSEPNCHSCNPMSYYDCDLYRELLALSSEIIRGADSSARIVLGGLWLYSLTPTYLDALLAGGTAAERFDIFNWHFYLMPLTRESIPFPLWKDTLAQWMEFFRSRLPAGHPIWMTEFGLPTRTAEAEALYSRTRGEIIGLTEEEQTDWFCQFAEAGDREWDIGTLVWYRLRDEDDSSHYYFSTTGMLRPDGSKKPVADRIAQYQSAKLLRGPREESRQW